MSYFFLNFQVSSFSRCEKWGGHISPSSQKTFDEIKVKLDGQKLEDPLFSFTMVLRSPKGLLLVSIRASEADPFHE